MTNGQGNTNTADRALVARLNNTGQPEDIRRARDMDAARAFVEREPEYAIWTIRRR